MYLAFSFLFPSVLLSCYHHLKAKLGMYFAPSIFEDFRMVWSIKVIKVYFWSDYQLNIQLWMSSSRPEHRLVFLRSPNTDYTIKVLLLFSLPFLLQKCCFNEDKNDKIMTFSFRLSKKIDLWLEFELKLMCTFVTMWGLATRMQA